MLEAKPRYRLAQMGQWCMTGLVDTVIADGGSGVSRCHGMVAIVQSPSLWYLMVENPLAGFRCARHGRLLTVMLMVGVAQLPLLPFS